VIYFLKGNGIKTFQKWQSISTWIRLCKGEYSVGLAERYLIKNFVGIDIKGARFWRGAKTAVETGLHNVALFVPKSN
jgi:tRNA G46 methylase TrmB